MTHGTGKRHAAARGRAILASACALLLTSLSCGHLQSLRIPPIPGGNTPVHVSKLDNGLAVLIKEDHSNPIVTVDVWVNTGSANEPTPISGISHYLEHMMFKGTKKRPVGGVDLDIENVGGETNAATSKDFTHYYITVASEFVTTGLDVLSDVMMNSVIDAQELEMERRVILEEYRRKQDSPFSLLYDEISDVAFRSGPYKQSIIGTTETISSITRARMIDYYNRYYTPDNMCLVIVGDVRIDRILPQVNKYFGRFRRTHRPYEGLKFVTRRAGKNAHIIEKDVHDTYTILALPAPGVDKIRDAIIMDVLMTLLGEGRSSRLYQRLREKEQVVSSVSANYAASRRPSLFLVFATLEAGQLERMVELTTEEIERIRRRRVGARELSKAKRIRINEHYFANETTNGQSETLGLFYTLTGDPNFADYYLRQIARVTPADIQRVAREYLDPEQMAMVTVTPKHGHKVEAAEAVEEVE